MTSLSATHAFTIHTVQPPPSGAYPAQNTNDFPESPRLLWGRFYQSFAGYRFFQNSNGCMENAFCPANFMPRDLTRRCRNRQLCGNKFNVRIFRSFAAFFIGPSWNHEISQGWLPGASSKSAALTRRLRFPDESMPIRAKSAGTFFTTPRYGLGRLPTQYRLQSRYLWPLRGTDESLSAAKPGRGRGSARKIGAH